MIARKRAGPGYRGVAWRSAPLSPRVCTIAARAADPHREFKRRHECQHLMNWRQVRRTTVRRANPADPDRPRTAFRRPRANARVMQIQRLPYSKASRGVPGMTRARIRAADVHSWPTWPQLLRLPARLPLCVCPRVRRKRRSPWPKCGPDLHDYAWPPPWARCTGSMV